MATFTYVADRGFQKQTSPRVLTSQFGDGYAHRIADGINSINTSWDLTFSSRDLTDAAAIITFFETEAGIGYFYFTPPDEIVSYKVICPSWTITYESHVSRTITAKFIRVYQ